MSLRSCGGLVLILTLCAPPALRAARPMITDDARIVDVHACQVESWVRALPGKATEGWALPACNPTGNLELTYGGARTWEQGSGSRFTDEVFQAKTILRPVTDDAWGVALTLGADRHAARAKANGWPGDPYVNVPFSYPMRADTWIAHLNVGAVRLRDSTRTLGTWGFGNEVKLNEGLYFIPEAFRNDYGRPFFQVGLRQWVVPARVQVDATFGNRMGAGSAERWFSVGMRLLSPPFLP